MTTTLQPVRTARASSDKTITYGAVALGVGAIGIGIWLIMRRAGVAGGIKKKPGDPIGSTIYIQRRGPGMTSQVWVGFALSPHRSREDIVEWYGEYVDVPAVPATEWTPMEPIDVDVEASPTELPEREKTFYECLSFVGTDEAMGEYDSKWHDNVYDFGKLEEGKPWWERIIPGGGV